MGWMAPAGLSLDLIGVLILGVDVLRIQREQRMTAAEHERFLSDAFKGNGEFHFANTYLETGDYGSEGFDGDGGVDVRELHSTLKTYKEAISDLQEGMLNCIDFLTNSVNHSKDVARSSLAMTYVGLLLIAMGFCLQIVASVQPSLGGQ